MSPLEPNGLYNQLRKVYKRAITEGDLEAAAFIKQKISSMETQLINKMGNKLDNKNVKDEN